MRTAVLRWSRFFAAIALLTLGLFGLGFARPITAAQISPEEFADRTRAQKLANDNPLERSQLKDFPDAGHEEDQAENEARE